MRFFTVGIAVAGLAACATAGRPGTSGNSQLSGAIAIPADFQGSPVDFCEAMNVRTTDAAGARVGRSIVTPSADRCFYETSELPVNARVFISVERGGAVECMRGASIALTPDNVTIQVKPGEPQVADFEAVCQG
jgi:hypothetical protein